MFNRKPKDKKTYNLVFDIRNSSVASAIVEKEDYYNEIIYTNRKYISSLNNNPEDYVNRIFKLFEELVDEIHKDKLNKKITGKIDKVLCVFAAPWYETKIENFISKEKVKRTFTKVFINKHISINNKKEKTNKEIIENEIISINLNGYEVNEPFDKDFKEAKVSFYKGMVDKKVENFFKNKIKDNFKTKKIDFHTHPFVILNILKNNYHSINDFCLVDIGMNISEISIYRNGVFEEITSTPKGFGYLIDKISSEENSTKQTAASKIKLLSEEQLLDKSEEKKIIKLTKEIFSDIDKKNKEEKNISSSIFITTDKEFEKTFMKIFKNKEFYNEVLGLELEPIVRIINSETTKNLAYYRQDVSRDPILSILCNFSTIVF